MTKYFHFRKAKKRCHLAGLLDGCALAVFNLSLAAGFRYGGYLVVKGDVDLEDMMRYKIQGGG